MVQNTEGDKNSGEIFRLRIQMEILLLGWVRTSLALMGFGFVLARFGLFLREIASVSEIRIRSHRWLALMSTSTGTILILLGVAVLLISVYSHRRAVIRLERGDLGQPGRWSLGTILCLILAGLGTGLAIYLAAVEM
jgi:putative membrane protein